MPTLPSPRANLWARALRPGLRLMRRLSLHVKLWLLVLTALLPLLVLIGVQMQRTLSELRHRQLQQQAVVGLLRVEDTVRALQLRHGLSLRLVAGDAGAQARWPAANDGLRKAVQGLDAQAAASPVPGLAEAWAPRQRALLALLDTPASPPAALRALAQEDASLQMLSDLRDRIAEGAALATSGEARDLLLTVLLIDRLPAWQELLRRTEAQLEASALGGRPLAALPLREYRAGEVIKQALLARARLDAAVRSGAPIPAAWDNTHKASEQLASLSVGEPPELAALLASSRQATAMLDRLQAELFDIVQQDLAQSAAAQLQLLVLQAAATLVGVLLLVYLMVCLRASMLQSVTLLQANMRRIALGNLSLPRQVWGSDELAQMGSNLDTMTDRLSELVAEMRSSAVRVDQAGQTLAEDAKSLAQRGEDQAGVLQQALADLRQAGQAEAQNAQGLADAQALSARVLEQARHHQHGIGQTMAALGLLDNGVRQVAQVNATFDDIAFQADLLALNASVEAARAGEAGKGFGVVGLEVRQLARRCMEAASALRELLDQAVQQLGDVNSRGQELQAGLTHAVETADQASQRVHRIVEQATGQSAAMAQATAGVESLDALTQHNVELGRRSSQASQSLLFQAQSLHRSLARVHLRRGSADEARSLVERAAERVTQVGWDAAAAEFNDPAGPFVDRDLYVFAFDREERYLAHGLKPQWVGKMLSEVPSIQPEAFLEAAWAAAADGGGGWIEYQSPNTATGEAAYKNAYIAPVGGDAFIGCGVYRTHEAEVAGEAAASATSAASRDDPVPALA